MTTNEPKTAGVIAPPPRLYFGAFALAFMANVIFTLSISLSSSLLYLLSFIVFVLSAGFARWAFVSMAKQGTSANPNKQSDALITSGPFSISRNPIYVAMTGFYLAATCVAHTVWPLFFLVPLIAIMHWGVILREERYLAQIFGESYSTYKSTTRRWL